MSTVDLRQSSDYRAYSRLMRESREALGRSLDVPVERVLFAAGATGVLDAVLSALPQRSTLALQPYEFYDVLALAKLHRLRVIRPTTDQRQNDLDAFRRFIRRRRPQVVYLSHPNNPLGQEYDERDLKKLLRSLQRDQLCIVDQTLPTTHPLSVRWFMRQAPQAQLVIVRSFSKTHDMVADRIGYAVVPTEFPFLAYAHAPSGASLRKAIARLNDRKALKKRLARVQRNARIIARWAKHIPDVTWLDSRTEFGTLHLERRSAVDTAAELKRRGILMRTQHDLSCAGNFLRFPLVEPTASIKRCLRALEPLLRTKR